MITHIFFLIVKYCKVYKKTKINETQFNYYKTINMIKGIHVQFFVFNTIKNFAWFY